MLSGQSILCFGPSDWWGMNPSCTTHIMRHLARENRVLYVNPFSSDLLAGVGKERRRGLASRIGRKARSVLKWLRRPQKNLHVFSPLFVPIQGRPFFDRLNNGLLRMQLGLVSRALLSPRPILWVENIRAADMMEWFNPRLVLYHVSDLFASDSYSTGAEVRRQREEKITRRSDLIVCVSRRLYEMKKAVRNEVSYLPHGVDYDRFRAAAERAEPFEPIRDVRRPIAGYFGTMTAHNDIDLLVYCATHLQHVSFVLAGQITGGDYSELMRLPNVRLLGRVPYEKIPALCASFDVCMLQWKVSEWIRCCNPLKLFEYMASGRPIVSVEIDEATQYGDVVSIATSKEQFCDRLAWELQNDTSERRQRRLEIARHHSWEGHIETLSSWIEERLAAGSRCESRC